MVNESPSRHQKGNVLAMKAFFAHCLPVESRCRQVTRAGEKKKNFAAIFPLTFMQCESRSFEDARLTQLVQPELFNE